MPRRQALALVGMAAAMPALAQAPAFPPMPPAGRRPWADQVREIRIGLLTDENQADRLARTRAYRELISQHFGVPTRIYEAADYNGVVQGFSARQLEISGMGALVYARIWLDTNGNIEPLVTALNEDGVATYLSVMYVRADSPIRSLDDMRGKSLAFSDPNSTSGFLVPRSELREAGIDIPTYFSRTGFAGGQEQGVVAVLNRQYDAGVTATSAEGDPARGFNRGTFRLMVDKGQLNMNDIRIIWRSRPIPGGMIAARADLPQGFKDDMRAFHLALPGAYPEIYRQIERGTGAGYGLATHAMYEPILAMARAEAQARRQR
ncbi:phosphate/phosphite/phosphonate ABC transporter substrate-binding protein [Falsiroseomonas sp. HW251]|uniref:phosphate/phosphite/phosphonate ABC transporter substrate-binding protein n=1 Tax=Falsiroseomonas sp. HW251 TaxID=3390998 RepID=UPI003D313676